MLTNHPDTNIQGVNNKKYGTADTGTEGNKGSYFTHFQLIVTDIALSRVSNSANSALVIRSLRVQKLI